VRWTLVPALIGEGRFDEAERQIAAYDSVESVLSYSSVLVAFARHGDGPAAREALARAVKANPHVPKFLLGKQSLPERLPQAFSFGGEDEAVFTATELSGPWSRIEGARSWLAAFLRDRKRDRKQKRTTGRGKSTRGKRR
jgi:hypothetical protein